MNVSMNYDLDTNSVSTPAASDSSISLGRAALVTLVIVGTASATDCAVRGTLGYTGQTIVGMFQKKDGKQQPPKPSDNKAPDNTTQQ
jgi:hypothetical protein